jgi:hypothetical protein
MADYRGMYLTLFNAITDTINILQEAQGKTEELYMEQEDPKIIAMEDPKD